MIDHILSRLELADRYEANAKRHQRCKKKAPNWKNICATCLAAARWERAIASKLAVDHGLRLDDLMAESNAERRAERIWSGDIHKVTIGEILRCAAIAEESTMGSRRRARAAQRLIMVTDVLASTNAIQQLFRWAGEGSGQTYRVPIESCTSIEPKVGAVEEAG